MPGETFLGTKPRTWTLQQSHEDAILASFLCYLPEQRLGSHGEEETCQQIFWMELAGHCALFSLGFGHFPSPYPGTGAVSYHLFSKGR